MRPQSAGPPIPHGYSQRHGHLGGTWSRQQIARANKVEKSFAADPPSPLNGIALHQADMRRRTAKGSQAQPQEKSENLTQRRSVVGCRHGSEPFGLVPGPSAPQVQSRLNQNRDEA